MKRRAADSGKMRRPVKRTKITEGMYGNSMLYLKFVMLWATVVMADYMLEFRFEFLWPFWMMLRSVYDSFKYQGLAFSVFFICIALTSDMICFFFIPVQWVFFAASTYVWVQYVWYTDKGICLPTVVLCCVLVYVEGAMRGVRERGGGLGGGGLDLCRPFAAHCVGYPVVTLGFGVKSYVGHRMRLRRQREVQAENEFYYQLLRQALPEPTSEQPPKEEKTPVPNGSVEKTEQEKLAYLLSRANGSAVHACGAPAAAAAAPAAGARSKKDVRKSENGTCMHEDRACTKERPASNHNHTNKEKELKTQHSSSNGTVSAGGGGAAGGAAASGGGGVDEKPVESHDNHTPNDKSKGNSKASSKWEKKEKEANVQKEEKRKNRNKEKEKDRETTENNKSCEQIKENVKEKEAVNTKEVTNKEKEKEREKERDQREREKEARSWAEELRRVRAELAASRAGETELRKSLAAAQAAERARRHEHTQLKHAHDDLQIKVTSLTGWRAGERAALERRLGEERQRRSSAERQLQAAHRQQQQRQHQAKTSDCGGEWCRSRRAAADAESASLRRELQRSRDHNTQLQRELSDVEQQVSVLDARCREVSACAGAGAAGGEAAALQQQQLASALAVLKERASHLERSLSAETRIKLDLFSALGEAKRQLQIREGVITTQEKEIDELKAKIAQMLAVMPTDSFASPAPAHGGSKLRLPARLSPESLLHQANSQLDPNASVYTPKNPATCSDV